MIKIDISVVAYNSAQWLDNFFESLLRQSYPLELINLIFCDNGSRDTTREMLQRFQNEYAGIFASFQILYSVNNGFGRSHNLNIEATRSDYILVTNPDLEFESDSIVNVVDEAVKDDSNVASWELRQKPFEHPKIYNPLTLETPWSSAACILYRRSAFEAVGGFEPRIFLYGEDVELSFRFRTAGFIIKYCPSAVCWHYSYKTAGELKPAQFFGSVQSNIFIRLRYGNLRSIILGFLLYLKLFTKPVPVPDKNKNLFKNLIEIAKNAPYFIKHRKTTISFTSLSFDYSKARDGAFYELKKIEETPLVSIIIRTYDGRQEFLKQAVTSVIGQTYPNIELVIIEDGSSNNAAFVESIKNKLHHVVYAPLPKGGRCIAGNKGLELATGKYIGFLDDDDLFYADHIETLVNELTRNPSYAAAYSNAFEVQTEINSLLPLIYTETSVYIPYKEAFSRTKFLLKNYIPIQTILFKRELYQKLGGFDIELDCLEDWDLWTRYGLNHTFLYIPKTTSLYRVPANKSSRIARAKKMRSYNELAYSKQNELFFEKIAVSDIHALIQSIREETMFKRSFPRRVISKLKRMIVAKLIKIFS